MSEAMEPGHPELHVNEQRWRNWPIVVVTGILLASAALGVLLIPILQGREAGLDAYAAICRALGLAPGSPARAQLPAHAPPHPVSQVIWTPDLLQILATANPARGHDKVLEVCASCHGEKGFSTGTEFPHLAGQSGAAIYKQLSDYRTGSRANATMTEMAKALDESIIADVAAYYAAQPQRNPNPVTLTEPPRAIVQLVELGDPRRNIPPCAACHRHGAGGPIESPVLAEQRQEYLVAQLKLFASGERRNDVYGRMRSIAPRLEASEVDGLAAYYRAGLK